MLPSFRRRPLTTSFEPPLKRRDNSNENAKSPLGLNTPRRSASPFVINSLNRAGWTRRPRGTAAEAARVVYSRTATAADTDKKLEGVMDPEYRDLSKVLLSRIQWRVVGGVGPAEGLRLLL